MPRSPRRSLLVVLAALAAAGAGASVAAQERGWPTVGGDPAHAARATGPPPPYRVDWRARVPGGGAMTGPVVGADTVVVAGWDRVVGLSPEDGSTVWSVPRGKGPVGPPAVSGELAVYADGRGKRSSVVAVSLADGKRVWRVVTESPVVAGITPDPPSPLDEPGAGGAVYAALRGGTLLKLEAATGDRVWSFDTDGSVEGAPAVSGGTVVVVAQERRAGRATVHAVDAATGREIWAHAPEGAAAPASAAAIGSAAVVVGLGDGRVHALDVRKGSLLWEAQIRGGFSPQAVPAVPDDVYLADVFGDVYRLDARTGAERWLYRVPGDLLLGSPVVVGEWVVVGDGSGQVAALDASTGHRVWRREVGEGRIGPVAAPGERIFVAERGGGAVALTTDPQGVLVDEPSPTTLFLGRALLNYAVAAASLLLVLLGGYRASRRWRRDGQSAAEPEGSVDEQEA